ncbi:phage repressor protein [Macrococcus hajekii]|uniref:Phage repressor protein n=1 Tax=Macrococcus hajekii TaxID=198482 RepID=A0A4R6BK20_9STAP|nr:BRO family protein [Macrococcus hajekii]TDM02069.1 phage repressor protein [Macrococcus hajekii]GGB09807.1 hypothetical protein GCM10007190_17370 [Macrococcus hajekii]
MKLETWNGHTLRFIEVKGEWHAIGQDIANALNFRDPNVATRKLPQKYKGTSKVRTPGGEQIMITLTEKGIYRLIMRSNKPEAEAFQDFVFEVIKELRQQTGLEGFQVFRLMDKDHQKQAMERLYNALKTDDTEAVKFNSIKANTITNKAISIMYDLPKMISKEDMTPDMLADRQRLLDDVVNLMTMKEKYKLDISVSKAIYDSILKQVKTA